MGTFCYTGVCKELTVLKVGFITLGGDLDSFPSDSKWHCNVNEKNSIRQSVTKVKAIERINQNPERLTVAPPVPYNPIPTPDTHAKLQGLLPNPQCPQINISQSLQVAVPHQCKMHSQCPPQLPAINSPPSPKTCSTTAAPK
jgi:hypothetical protein